MTFEKLTPRGTSVPWPIGLALGVGIHENFWKGV